MKDLSNTKGLIVGIANENSIAYGCASSLKNHGCNDMIATYQNDKALPFVEQACSKINIDKLVKFDYIDEASVINLIDSVKNKIGSIDFLIHSMAFASKNALSNGLLNCSLEDFLHSINISVCSLTMLSRHLVKLMPKGGVIITMTYLGSNKVVPEYSVMGPVKACLESAVKYLAYELAKFNIRIFALSPGAINTRAANGIANFEKICDREIQTSPMHKLVNIEEVGELASFLIGSSAMTGNIIYVDNGFSMM